MNQSSFIIAGGDFDKAGAASSALKELLKKIGADPEAIRRAMIAAYEAEMNVVIHAYRGVLRVSISPRQVDVEVIDEGPGIADIRQALKEGFSTAPQSARDLGFGAGMGLPNIKKNSNRFTISSTPGKGTTISFTIFLQPQTGQRNATHSILLVEDSCNQCLKCLSACPAQAIRLRNSKPVILEHLCIDCTSCIQACKSGAILPMVTPGDNGFQGHTLLLPTAFPFQFGDSGTETQVLEILAREGISDVRFLSDWEEPLRAAINEYVSEEATHLPVISPVCPSVINLIEMRFPSLLKHVAPFLSPLEAAGEDLAERQSIFIASCPSQHTALSSRRLCSFSQIRQPAGLRGLISKHIKKSNAPTIHGAAASASVLSGALEVCGIQNVIRILEKMENGLIQDVRLFEFYACDLGCFGSPLLIENAYLLKHRRSQSSLQNGTPGHIYRRTHLLSPRTGMRLDDDMSAAIEKLSAIESLRKSLPGRDCGVCGSPTCEALAEDVILGLSTVQLCPFTEKSGGQK